MILNLGISFPCFLAFLHSTFKLEIYDDSSRVFLAPKVENTSMYYNAVTCRGILTEAWRLSLKSFINQIKACIV